MQFQHMRFLKECFCKGLSFSEIQQLLRLCHKVTFSIRHIRRVANRMGLFKRKQSNIDLCINFLRETLLKTGSLHGYRWMQQKCIKNGLVISKEKVRVIMKCIDPSNVLLRRNNTLRRREYESHGPNELWHIDGYDKLKPYGIAIHGCIDGFSRKILWLKAGTTNNDPKVIAGYFMATVTKTQGCPIAIRSDFGTENGHVEQMQRFLRRHGTDARSKCPFLYGASTQNQRIEFIWAVLRRKCTQFWIELFHQLKKDGHFNGSYLDRNILRFCFLQIIQDRLTEFACEWNEHPIRPNKNSNGPSGRPMVIYSAPELYDAVESICPIDVDDISVCFDECRYESNAGDEDIVSLCDILMSEVNWARSNDPFQTIDLYLYLKNAISRELY